MGRVPEVFEFSPFSSLQVYFQWFLIPDERSLFVGSFGYFLDRFGSYYSFFFNEFVFRFIFSENVSGSMSGVWVEVFGVRDSKIERFMINTEQREETVGGPRFISG